MLTIIILILLFAALVVVHEFGHFIEAKRNGVDVEEFGIGFPPKIGGRTIRGTLYSINWLPLGGFVRMKGEDSDDTGPGTFGGAKLWVQSKILLAGVIMNLITAFVLLYGLCITGLPGLGAPFEPNFLHSTYAQPKQLILTEIEAGSPAAGAGLKVGDYVLSGNGKPFTAFDQLRDFTKDEAGHAVTLGVREGSSVHNVTVKLRGAKANGSFLGVSAQQVYKLHYNLLNGIVAAGYITVMLFGATIWGVIELIIHIPALIVGLFSSSVPQAAQDASGPVGIFFILRAVSSLGYAYVLLFMANIAAALAAFNVLPLPALDGGRLAVILAQRVSKRRVSGDTESRIHAIGFLALIGLMILITVYDFRKYF